MERSRASVKSSRRKGLSSSLELAWGIGLLLLFLLLPTHVSLAFDPHEFGFDSDDSVAKTKFCLTNDGYGWNAEAVERAGDAIERIEQDVPGFELIMDRTLNNCHVGADRIEILWEACPAFANQYIGITWWEVASGTGFVGTHRIEMMKWKSCGDTSSANLVKWDFNPSDGIGSAQLDFQEVLQHEIGHGVGLHHPEMAGIISTRPGASTYPSHSFDGNTSVILMRDATTPGQRHVALTQDDIAGFKWSDGLGAGYWPVARLYLARPNEPRFWATYQGNVTSGNGYLSLTKDPGVPQDDYSWMSQTIRMSTDGREVDRETPYAHVQWRKKFGSSWNDQDRLRVRIAWQTVGSTGALGTWQYQWGETCTDDHSNDVWESCGGAFFIGHANVQNIRLFIYNSTVGIVELNSIDLEDYGT